MGRPVSRAAQKCSRIQTRASCIQEIAVDLQLQRDPMRMYKRYDVHRFGDANKSSLRNSIIPVVCISLDSVLQQALASRDLAKNLLSTANCSWSIPCALPAKWDELKKLRHNLNTPKIKNYHLHHRVILVIHNLSPSFLTSDTQSQPLKTIFF